MGAGNSKIDTTKIPLSDIKSINPVEQSKFCPPFRRFRQQALQNVQQVLTAIIQIEEPVAQSFTVSEACYKDMEDAFDSKTREIQLESLLMDDNYLDLRTFVGTDGGKPICLHLKPFETYNSFLFNSMLYEIHLNEQITKLKCDNLNCIVDSYVIETGLHMEGEESPNTQVNVLEPIATNLSQIIVYRREHKEAWTTNQFNALAHDLINAVKALHEAKIAHNDIRPSNVYFSLEKNCYQLGNFANAVKTHETSYRNTRISTVNGAPELSTSNEADLQMADIYSLGMTLLSAFYLCEPIDRKLALELNKKYSYDIVELAKRMIMPVEKRISLAELLEHVDKGQNSTKMKDFFESLKYKNAPKDKKLVNTMRLLSEGYQRLGLWNDWRRINNQAYQLEEDQLDDFQKANQLFRLAKISSCAADPEAATSHAKSSSKLFRQLGYSAFEAGNVNQSLTLFTKAVETTKYFENKNDMEAAKNFQGLALVHSEKGDYELALPLAKEAALITNKSLGSSSIDYCKTKLTEAKIQTDFGKFDEAQKILFDCLRIAEDKTKVNLQQGMRLKAQVLHDIGRNQIMQSTYDPARRAQLLQLASTNINQSIDINDDYPQNELALGDNFQALGDALLRKQKYQEAKDNYAQAQKFRQAYDKENPGKHPIIQRQKAQAQAHFGACQNGLGNLKQALVHYNKSLDMFRQMYGSDHNKLSAITIGNMSKVYYKKKDLDKARECLNVSTKILKDLVGEDDPDYELFSHLLRTL